jgi:uncharacterized protein
MIIFHHNDLDGRCAAAIAYRHFCRPDNSNNLQFIEMDYAKPVPVERIQPGERVVILDFSFKPDVMNEVLDRSNDVTWIDHHVTAKDYDYGESLPGLRDFSEKGLSGCELAWEYYFTGQPMPRAVSLIGDYDAWRLQLAPQCFQFYEGLKLIKDQAPRSLFWNDLFCDYSGLVAKVLTEGQTAILYRDAYCEDFIKQFGYETELDGVKMFAVNLYRFGSKCFGERMKQYPACIGYAHDGEKYIVSVYSEQIDVSGICKAHGGGGHKGAAGFSCVELPFAIKDK